MIPIELILYIYNLCDKSTRININRAYDWSYKEINPYKDHMFIDYKKSYVYNLKYTTYEISKNGNLLWNSVTLPPIQVTKI